MKCEKCGLEIKEGEICENCGNVGKNETSQPIIDTETNTTNQIPEQYDPVADLMNETVVGTVNTSKSELENSIPLGENKEIPPTPVNENVVNVSAEPVIKNEQSIPVIDSTNEPQIVQEEIQTTNSQEETQMQTSTVIEKKKTKISIGTIIIIVIAILLGLLIILFVPQLINNEASIEIFNQSRNEFVRKI